jgi:PAS domain S-box-containing protein
MAEWHWELKPTYDGLIRAIELMSCGMIVEDADGLIHYANARVLEWTGYVAEELDGQPISILVPEEFHADLETERQKVLDGDLRTRLSAVQRKDGRTFPVAVAPQPFQRVDTMGAAEDSLAADLAHVALKLQSMSLSASMVSQGAFPVDHPLLRELSAREREVLALLMSGARVPAIAKQLFISPNTVRNHLKAIYRKVDVSSQSDLVEWVRSLGAP